MDEAFGFYMRVCALTVQDATEYKKYIPIFWVPAEATPSALYPDMVACAPINGAQSRPPWQDGWQASVVIGPGAARHYAVTVAHELGRVLYLDSSRDPRSVMYPGRPCTAGAECINPAEAPVSASATAGRVVGSGEAHGRNRPPCRFPV